MEVYKFHTFLKSRAFSKFFCGLIENFITWMEQFTARGTDIPDLILPAKGHYWCETHESLGDSAHFHQSWQVRCVSSDFQHRWSHGENLWKGVWLKKDGSKNKILNLKLWMILMRKEKKRYLKKTVFLLMSSDFKRTHIKMEGCI